MAVLFEVGIPSFQYQKVFVQGVWERKTGENHLQGNILVA